MNLRKKSGFTLIELLAVIVILAIILVIVTVSVRNSINSSKEKTRYTAAEEIVNIAKAYMASEKIGVMSQEIDGYNYTYVTVKTLIDQGYLEKDVTNPVNGENGFSDENANKSMVVKGNYVKQEDEKIQTNGNTSYYTFDGYAYVYGELITGNGSEVTTTTNHNTTTTTTKKTTTTTKKTTTKVPSVNFEELYIIEGTKIISLSEVGEDYYRDHNEVVIPEGITEIGNGAFLIPYGYDGELIDFDLLQKVYGDLMNNGTISDSDMENMTKAMELVEKQRSLNTENKRFEGYTLKLPSTLEKIGEFAFYGLKFSDDLIIPENVTEILPFAFSDTGFTGNLEILGNLSRIDCYAFSNVKISGELTLPSTVESIEIGAFTGMGLTGALYLPSSVKSIAFAAFTGNNLSSVSIYEGTSYSTGLLKSFDTDVKINKRTY